MFVEICRIPVGVKYKNLARTKERVGELHQHTLSSTRRLIEEKPNSLDIIPRSSAVRCNDLIAMKFKN